MRRVWFRVLNRDGRHARVVSSEHKRSNQETCPRAKKQLLGSGSAGQTLGFDRHVQGLPLPGPTDTSLLRSFCWCLTSNQGQAGVVGEDSNPTCVSQKHRNWNRKSHKT